MDDGTQAACVVIEGSEGLLELIPKHKLPLELSRKPRVVKVYHYREREMARAGWFRECELRHGRTAMLAVLGFIATDYFRIPGDMYSFEAIPKTIDAHDILLKSGPMYQLALWIGLFDLVVTAPAVQAMGEGEREPGDFAWYWFAPKSDEEMEKKRNSELMNGRLAMMAVGGIATQSILGGHGFPYLY